MPEAHVLKMTPEMHAHFMAPFRREAEERKQREEEARRREEQAKALADKLGGLAGELYLLLRSVQQDTHGFQGSSGPALIDRDTWREVDRRVKQIEEANGG